MRTFDPLFERFFDRFVQQPGSESGNDHKFRDLLTKGFSSLKEKSGFSDQGSVVMESDSDWKASTDRALANTEMILRSLDQPSSVRGTGLATLSTGLRSNWLGAGTNFLHEKFESSQKSASFVNFANSSTAPVGRAFVVFVQLTNYTIALLSRLHLCLTNWRCLWQRSMAILAEAEGSLVIQNSVIQAEFDRCLTELKAEVILNS